MKDVIKKSESLVYRRVSCGVDRWEWQPHLLKCPICGKEFNETTPKSYHIGSHDWSDLDL